MPGEFISSEQMQSPKGGGGVAAETQNKNSHPMDGSFCFGASDEARTRYLHLGKVALYQMSYTRSDKKDSTKNIPVCQEKIFVFLKFL